MRLLLGAMLLTAALALTPPASADDAHANNEHAAKHGVGSPRNEGRTVNGGLLGEVDALVGFCSAADPRSAEKYRAFGAKLTPGVSEKALREAHATSDYKQVFKDISALLESIPRTNRSAACQFLFVGP